MKGIRKFFGDGGGSDSLSLSYYSADVEVRWTVDVEAPDSLQVVYERKHEPNFRDEDFWLYLSPRDAAVIGAILTGYAAAHGETA